MLDFLTWMNGTPWSVALRESLFVWPIVEAAHVVTLMLFVGTIIMVDLRLVGWAFTRVPVSEFDRRILPWTIAGFVLMLLTGLALFYAKPLVYYHSLFFRLKMLVLLFGLAQHSAVPPAGAAHPAEVGHGRPAARRSARRRVLFARGVGRRDRHRTAGRL